MGRGQPRSERRPARVRRGWREVSVGQSPPSNDLGHYPKPDVGNDGQRRWRREERDRRPNTSLPAPKEWYHDPGQAGISNLIPPRRHRRPTGTGQRSRCSAPAACPESTMHPAASTSVPRPRRDGFFAARSDISGPAVPHVLGSVATHPHPCRLLCPCSCRPCPCRPCPCACRLRPHDDQDNTDTLVTSRAARLCSSSLSSSSIWRSISGSQMLHSSKQPLTITPAVGSDHVSSNDRRLFSSSGTSPPTRSNRPSFTRSRSTCSRATSIASCVSGVASRSPRAFVSLDTRSSGS